MFYSKNFDVIVIGGGHAGTEAAAAASRMGSKTLLLTQNIETIGQMSCNPAIGGIGKGHLVKEIDALGGIMGDAADQAGIHFRTLNASKGPAVQATRVQTDRNLYKQRVQEILSSQNNLFIFQQSVVDFIIKDYCIKGVITSLENTFYGNSIVLTTGTFLGGRIYIGSKHYQGGRAGDAASNDLAKKLRKLPFKVGRLKTGTPPRLQENTIDFSNLETQESDKATKKFSFFKEQNNRPKQKNCYITYTNKETHQIITENIEKSVFYGGIINSAGPRYCPSIEDKVVRFNERDRHQIFIEPEGLSSIECYPNGISTSLPLDIQLKFIRSIKGFEQAFITRPGYSIEYDFFDPTDLLPTLETKYIQNLFFAGQINGTTGYEEAAAQGIVAGVNSALKAKKKPTWSPKRNESYIGVLIDDLITKGIQEPYRMFTSRAEYRLILRESNADIRLSPIGIKLGLLNNQKKRSFLRRKSIIEEEIKKLKSIWLKPSAPETQEINSIIEKPILREYNLFNLLKRPEITFQILKKICRNKDLITLGDESKEVETIAKYEGYVKRQNEKIKVMKTLDKMSIPKDFDYGSISSLSNEARQKLYEYRPCNIGIASRIQGITPATVSLLIIHIKKYWNKQKD